MTQSARGVDRRTFLLGAAALGADVLLLIHVRTSLQRECSVSQ